MEPQDLVQHFGSVTKVARAFGIRPPSVHGWIQEGRVPIPRQFQAEVLTNGALKAERNTDHCAA